MQGVNPIVALWSQSFSYGAGCLGALTLRGFIAPLVLDGPINCDAFETYVARVLVPELRPGDIVVMDNLSSHKGPR